MFEDLENKSPLVQLLAVAGFIAILLFIAGLFLGFLLGIAGRIPGYGGRVKYKGPGDWIEFYKNEIIEPLRESKTRRWYSAFEAKWIVEEPSPLERSLLIFKEGQFHIGVGGTLSAAALIIVFTI